MMMHMVKVLESEMICLVDWLVGGGGSGDL